MFTPRDQGIFIGLHCEKPELNFDVYAEQLCKIAIKATDRHENAPSNSESEGAFTVGIFGSWGSGKTTLMSLIKKKIQDPEIQRKLMMPNCKFIWFNAWKYDGKEDIRNALIQTILSEMSNDPDLSNDKCKEIMKAALSFGLCTAKVAGHLTRGAIKTATQGVIDTGYISSEIEKVFQDGKEKRISPYQFINNFENVFKAAVQTCVGEKGRLIVFIDDLDRCLPENALAVLESIKLYLDQANCIFYIGLDKRIIEQAVGQRYPKDLGISGKEYIEKIIRLNFFLPDKDGDEVKNRLIEGGLTGSYSHNQEMWEMIKKATESNVRKVQQFTIAFYLIQEIVNALNEKLEEQVKHQRITPKKMQEEKIDWKTIYPKLGKILLIQLNYPGFYDALAKNHKLMHEINEAFTTEGSFENLIAVQEKYPGCNNFFGDRNLIEFVVESFNCGKISSSEDWKIIQKLSKSVTY